MRPLVLAGLILVLVTLSLAQDPCTLITPNVGAGWIGALPTLKSCFNSIKPNKEMALSTVEAIKRTIDLYSFTDLSLESGAPYYINVNLRSGIFNIDQYVKSNTFRSDYHFHEKVMDLLNPLYDAHTLYRAPDGYLCYTVRPHNIEATYHIQDGSMRFILRQGPLGAASNNLWRTHFGQDLSSTLDKHIVAINDVPVADYLRHFVDNFVSTYKDQAVRFNAALRTRYSQVILTQFPLNGKHVTESDVYTLASGEKITLTNAGFCASALTSATELERRNRFPTLKTAESLEQMTSRVHRQVLEGKDIHIEMEQEWKEALRLAGLDAQPQSTMPTTSFQQELDHILAAKTGQGMRIHDYRAIHKTVGKEFYNVQNSKTFDLPITNFDPSFLKVMSKSPAEDAVFSIYTEPGKEPYYILRWKTFSPPDQTASLKILNDLLTHAQSTGAKKIILDVAFNGGGLICLSDLLIAVLVEQWGDLAPVQPGKISPLGLYDFRQSKSSDSIRNSPLMNSAFTSNTRYLDPETMRTWNTSFFEPIRRARGGLVSGYTKLGLFPASCINFPGNWKPVKHFFQEVYILTDGTCGSACALFASQLQSNNFATVISYGGYVNNIVPLSTASFAGGNVLEYQSVAQYAASVDPANKLLPPIMNSSGRARFNFNEYYELNDLTTPREFLKRPASLHIDFWATLFNDNTSTPLGLANTAALYGAVTSAIEFQP